MVRLLGSILVAWEVAVVVTSGNFLSTVEWEDLYLSLSLKQELHTVPGGWSRSDRNNPATPGPLLSGWSGVGA